VTQGPASAVRAALALLAAAVLVAADGPAAQAASWQRTPINGANDQSDARAAVGAGGAAAVVWSGISGRIRVESSPAPGAPFGRVRNISNCCSPVNPVDPTVAVSPSGEVLAAWQGAPDPSAIYARRGDVTGRWGPVTRVSLPGTFDDSATVAISADGTAIVAWIDEPGLVFGNGFVEAAIARPGEPFTAAQMVSGYETGSTPDVAVTADDRASVTWVGSGDSLRAADRLPSGGFSSPYTIVETPATSPQQPSFQTALDGDGTVLALWNPTSQLHAIAEAAPARAAAPPAATFASDPYQEHFQVAAGPGGHGIVCWVLAGENAGGTVMALTGVHDRWGAPTALMTLATGEIGDPTCAIDATGRAVVSWDDDYRLYTTTRSPRGTWSPPISPTSGVALEAHATSHGPVLLVFDSERKTNLATLHRSWPRQ